MDLVTRSQWGASPARATTRLDKRGVVELVYHYSAADADEQADHANCARRVKGIQTFHMGPAREWSDIAYNFLVCKHGTVFEGRGWDIRSAATGAANDYSLACCFLGDDTAGRDDVTVKGRLALVELARLFKGRYPNGRRFGGHRDHMQTSCPGDEIHSFIRSAAFRKAVDTDDPKRRAVLRAWILAQHTAGKPWNWIKGTPNWREYVRRGGR